MGRKAGWRGVNRLSPTGDCTCSQFKNNYFTEICSGSEEGSYSRLIDFVYHSTLGLGVIKKDINKGVVGEGRDGPDVARERASVCVRERECVCERERERASVCVCE